MLLEHCALYCCLIIVFIFTYSVINLICITYEIELSIVNADNDNAVNSNFGVCNESTKHNTCS